MTRADTRRVSIVGMWVLEVNESRDASKRERSSDEHRGRHTNARRSRTIRRQSENIARAVESEISAAHLWHASRLSI